MHHVVHGVRRLEDFGYALNFHIYTTHYTIGTYEVNRKLIDSKVFFFSKRKMPTYLYTLFLLEKKKHESYIHTFRVICMVVYQQHACVFKDHACVVIA